MILSVVLGHKGGYTRFTGEDTKAQGDEETAGPRRSQGLSGANGGGTALAGRSPARCALAAPHEEECPWHRTIREVLPHVLASENHVCPSCAKCQPRYPNYPIKSSQQVGMYYPHFVDKKMEARRGLVHNRPPTRAGAAGATRLAPARCCLPPRNCELQVVPLSPNAGRVFISWRPQTPLLFCRVCHKSRSCEFVLQVTLRGLPRLC